MALSHNPAQQARLRPHFQKPETQKSEAICLRSHGQAQLSIGRFMTISESLKPQLSILPAQRKVSGTTAVCRYRVGGHPNVGRT